VGNLLVPRVPLHGDPQQQHQLPHLLLRWKELQTRVFQTHSSQTPARGGKHPLLDGSQERGDSVDVQDRLGTASGSIDAKHALQQALEQALEDVLAQVLEQALEQGLEEVLEQAVEEVLEREQFQGLQTYGHRHNILSFIHTFKSKEVFLKTL